MAEVWGIKTPNFFTKLPCRGGKQTVLRLKEHENSWVEDEEEIISKFEEFYKNLFKTSSSREWGNVFDCILKLVDANMNEILTVDVTEEEVKEAVFQLGAFKAPGSDGLMVCFSKILGYNQRYCC